MIRRTYSCSDCNFKWTITCNYEDATPDCPVCEQLAQREFVPIAIGTNKGKAVDFTQRMVEETMGMTDLRDNQRPGDIAAVGPAPVQSAESEHLTRQAVEMARSMGVDQPTLPPGLQQQADNFWGGTPANMAQVDMSAARASSAAAAKDGVDALSILGNAKSQGMNYDVIGAAPLKQ